MPLDALILRPFAPGLGFEFRLPGGEVKVSRTARGILLEPLVADAAERQRKFLTLAGSCPNLADVPPHVAKDIPRD